MSNLRTYINLIEERGRTDRAGNRFDSADNSTVSNPNTSKSASPNQDWKPTVGGTYNAAGYAAPTTTLGGLAKTKATVKPAGSTAPRVTAPHQATKPVAKASAVPPARQGSQPTQAAKVKTTAPKTAYSGSQYGYQSPEDVKGIQQTLVNMGYAMPVDGKWGPKTDAAYKAAYQQMYGAAPGQDLPPNAAKPDEWTQATTAKQGQSADIAAATGMPNPYVKTQPAAATTPTQQPATGSNFDARGNIIGMPPKVTSTAAPMGRDASGKAYTDWTGNNPIPGAKSLEESDLSRIKDLINYKK